MLKIVLLPLLFAVVSGGIIGAPLSHGPTYTIGHAPLVAVAHTPLVATHASSYSNTVRVVHSSVPIVATPVVHAPVVAAPLAIGHATLIHGYH